MSRKRVQVCADTRNHIMVDDGTTVWLMEQPPGEHVRGSVRIPRRTLLRLIAECEKERKKL